MIEFKIDENYQTPPVVAEYMAGMVDTNVASYAHYKHYFTVLEPTPGLGNLVTALLARNFCVQVPDGDFWEEDFTTKTNKIHYVVMNPPFSPVSEMVAFVTRAIELSDNVIALLPWTYIINSENRLKTFQDFGLVSITNLPRKTFPGCRVQSMIVHLQKGYQGQCVFKHFTW